MKTEELIESLAGDLSPIPPRTVERRVGGGLVLGILASGLLMLLTLGLRKDMAFAAQSFSFWMKLAYSALLAGVAACATIRLSRPDTEPPRWLWLLAVPVLSVVLLSAAELIRTPSDEWLAMWLGRSWWKCPLLLLFLSAPILFLLVRAEAKLAPTRLRLAGALTGLTAGATAALVYCLHCPETSACFLMTWYSAGIALSSLAGAWLGPRLLRW